MRLAFLPLLALASCVSIDKPPSAPRVAYAWMTFNAEGAVDSGASGLADRAIDRQLTIDDPVRIASISKLVVALGAMRMVEQGRLDLDRDVSDYIGWPLRNPAFPDRPITLRMLLSHRSSLRDEIDYAIPLGRTLREALADPTAFDAGHSPGTYFRYSNLNFPVVASVMERASGERFDRLMAELVLEPLGLDACFNWTTCGDGSVPGRNRSLRRRSRRRAPVRLRSALAPQWPPWSPPNALTSAWMVGSEPVRLIVFDQLPPGASNVVLR